MSSLLDSFLERLLTKSLEEGVAVEELIREAESLPPEDKAIITEGVMQLTADMLWCPNPGPQTLARESLADELFLGGSAGGGKSSTLVGTAIQDHQSSLIFRKQYTQIRGLEDEAQRILKTRDGYNSQDKIWRIPGSTKVLEFGSCATDADLEKWQGRPHDLIGFDEITHFPEAHYRFLIGWNRSADANQRCRVICTGNPPMKAEQMWVIKYWGAWLDPKHPNPAKPGELRWYTTKDGKDTELLTGDPVEINGRMVTPRSRTFIPARLEDNPDLMRTNYASVLESMPEEIRKRLRDGQFVTELQDDEWQLLPSAWVLAAQDRWTEDGRKQPMTSLGVDVAQGGPDSTVLAPRHGQWIDRPIKRPGVETPDGRSVVALIVRHRTNHADIRVDKGGGYGGATLEHLRANDIPNAVGVGPSDGTAARSKDGANFAFVNQRAEMFWRLREGISPDNPNPIALPPGQEIFVQLCSIHYEIVKGGVKVEAKEDIISRIGHSPDEADAIALTCMAPNNPARHAQGSGLIGRPIKSLPTTANMGYSKFKLRSVTRRQH